MTGEHPRTGARHEPERIHERAADPAEAADRPLEPRAPDHELRPDDEGGQGPTEEPHHPLNTAVGEVHRDADSDPFREPGGQEEADRASGTTGSGQGAER